MLLNDVSRGNLMAFCPVPVLFFQIVIWWFVSFLDSRELFSPAQKYQMLVYHADAIFHDKEYRNAACKYSMALQQKKVLSKTSKVRTSTGGAASNIQAQVCCEESVHLKHFDWSCNTTCGVKDICHFFCTCPRFWNKSIPPLSASMNDSRLIWNYTEQFQITLFFRVCRQKLRSSIRSLNATPFWNWIKTPSQCLTGFHPDRGLQR